MKRLVIAVFVLVVAIAVVIGLLIQSQRSARSELARLEPELATLTQQLATLPDRIAALSERLDRESRQAAVADPEMSPARAAIAEARAAIEQVMSGDAELVENQARLQALAAQREKIANRAKEVRAAIELTRRNRLQRVEEEYAPRLAELKEPVTYEEGADKAEVLRIQEERSQLARQFGDAKQAARAQADQDAAAMIEEAQDLEASLSAVLKEMHGLTVAVRDRRKALMDALPPETMQALHDARDTWQKTAADSTLVADTRDKLNALEREYEDAARRAAEAVERIGKLRDRTGS